MEDNKICSMAEGTWIIGEDACFNASVIGYIVSISIDKTEIIVFVIESEAEDLLNTERICRISDVTTLDIEPLCYPGEVYNLIDMALDEKNESWFNSLCCLLVNLEEK